MFAFTVSLSSSCANFKLLMKISVQNQWTLALTDLKQFLFSVRCLQNAERWSFEFWTNQMNFSFRGVLIASKKLKQLLNFFYLVLCGMVNGYHVISLHKLTQTHILKIKSLIELIQNRNCAVHTRISKCASISFHFKSTKGLIINFRVNLAEFGTYDVTGIRTKIER